MAIPEQDRARLEAIGFTAVRRELEVGNVYYLHGDVQRRQAREWVAEKEAEAEQERRKARRLATAGLVVSIVGAVAAIIAAVAAVITAVPVVRDWLR
jgi:hypothetical protein